MTKEEIEKLATGWHNKHPNKAGWRGFIEGYTTRDKEADMETQEFRNFLREMHLTHSWELFKNKEV